MTQYLVSVVIPTVRRREGLERAIDSVQKQTGIDASDTEILVVDNDPAASARETAAQYESARIKVRYVHEPSPGVANARNKAVSSVNSRLIAFLDDDESATPHWLSHLITTWEKHQAAVTFGPVETSLPAETTQHIDYLKAFFSRKGPEKSGMYNEFYGCGNSLLDLSQFPAGATLFDVWANDIGGEDDFLFSGLQQKGHKFGWAADASVFEHVPESRANLKYAMKRTFAYGQAPTTICARSTPRNMPGMAYWIAVGTGQTLVYGGLSACMWLVRYPKRAFWFDKAAQGLGKVLWFGPFELKFYGVYAS